MHTVYEFLVSVFSFVIVLGIMVIVHEFGHFAVAKLCKVRIEAFAVGFGPRIVGIIRGGTDYRINALPFGGYVKMAGELPGEEVSDDPGDFQNHPRWQRILIGLGGPTANFILAFALMAGFYMLHNEVPNYLSQPAVLDWVPPTTDAATAGLKDGDKIVRFAGKQNPSWDSISALIQGHINQAIPVVVDRNGQQVASSFLFHDESGGTHPDIASIGLLPNEQPTPITVDQVSPGTPAARAGILRGDQFLSVDGHVFHGLSSMIDYLQFGKGAPINISVLRNGTVLPVDITPVKMDQPKEGSAYRIGFTVVPPPSHIEQMAFAPALAASFQFNQEQSTLILNVLKSLFGHRMKMDSLSGPIGIAQQTGQAAESHDLGYIIKLMTMISINLGILNLLPFPILDGGLILFLLIESAIRRDVNMAIKERVYQAAFILIILFAVYISVNDITKIAFTH
jgi:regulator of sigma E protease